MKLNESESATRNPDVGYTIEELVAQKKRRRSQQKWAQDYGRVTLALGLQNGLIDTRTSDEYALASSLVHLLHDEAIAFEDLRGLCELLCREQELQEVDVIRTTPEFCGAAGELDTLTKKSQLAREWIRDKTRDLSPTDAEMLLAIKPLSAQFQDDFINAGIEPRIVRDPESRDFVEARRGAVDLDQRQAILKIWPEATIAGALRNRVAIGSVAAVRDLARLQSPESIPKPHWAHDIDKWLDLGAAHRPPPDEHIQRRGIWPVVSTAYHPQGPLAMPRPGRVSELQAPFFAWLAVEIARDSLTALDFATAESKAKIALRLTQRAALPPDIECRAHAILAFITTARGNTRSALKAAKKALQAAPTELHDECNKNVSVLKHAPQMENAGASAWMLLSPYVVNGTFEGDFQWKLSRRRLLGLHAMNPEILRGLNIAQQALRNALPEGEYLTIPEDPNTGCLDGLTIAMPRTTSPTSDADVDLWQEVALSQLRQTLAASLELRVFEQWVLGTELLKGRNGQVTGP